jgi:hypothetical protein
LLDRYQAPESPPPPKSLGGLHEGIGAGSGAAIEGAVGFGAERRFGAALRADFFLVDFFADAFIVFRFLRAGAAFFFFLVDRFFALVLFAIMDLPILVRFKTRASFTPCPASNALYDTPHPRLGFAQPVAVAGRFAGFVAASGRCSRSAGGQGPPVAQSINSTVWTAGSSVPAAI